MFGGQTEAGDYGNEINHTTLECRKLTPVPNSELPPSARIDSAMVCYGRKLVIFGGRMTSQFSNELYVFDLDSSEAYYIYDYITII